MRGNKSTRANQEELLLDFARRLDRHRKDRRAVYIRIGDFGSRSLVSPLIRQAASYFHAMVKAETGQLFRLANGDMIFASKGASRVDIEGPVYQIMHDLKEDPLADGYPGSIDDIVEWFEMESDYEAFLALAERLAAGEMTTASPSAQSAAQPAAGGDAPSILPDDSSFNAAPPASREKPRPAPPVLRARPKNRPHPVVMHDGPKRAFTPGDLDRLESSLRLLDVEGLMETHNVAAITGQGPAMAVFTEEHFSYEVLGARVLPGCDLRSDPVLFERLSHLIDMRILQTLRYADDGGVLATSFTSNVEAVLSDAFAKFDYHWRRSCQRPTIVEFRFIDVMRSVKRFFEARDKLRDLGYRVCVKNMDAFDFAMLDRKAPMADFEKIRWRVDYPLILTGDWLARFQASAAAAGRGRLILSNSDSAEAVKEGRKLGFSLFQGSYIDTLMAAQAEMRAQARA